MSEQAPAGTLRLPWICLGVATVTASDLLLKAWMASLLELARPMHVLPVLDLRLQYNRGIAFSFFDDADNFWRWPLSALGAAVTVFLAAWLYRLPAGQPLSAWGLTLLLGGALGNLLERLVFGHITDFISLHWAGWYFPTFNLADTAITVGVIAVALDSFAVNWKSSL